MWIRLTGVPSRSGIWLESGTLDIGNSIVANNSVTDNLAISGGAFESVFKIYLPLVVRQ